MVTSAVVGGVILGLIEGVSLLIQRVSGDMMLKEQSNFSNLFLKKNLSSNTYFSGSTSTINSALIKINQITIKNKQNI